jgi:cyclohexanecarboxylate-CoA ligase
MTAVDRLPLWELIEWRAAATPAALAAVDEDGGELDFQGYRDACLRVAAGLQARGVGRGTPVAWMLPTRSEALVLAGGLARLGAVQVPLIPILRQREVGFILVQTGARHLVVPGVWRGFDYPAMAAAAAGVLPVDVMVADRDLPVGDPAGLVPWEAPAADPVRWIFYTSGTTANPKGTQHTDGTVAAIAYRLNGRFEMTPADRNGLVFPVGHIGGISWLMGGLMAGYGQILIEAFSAETSCAVLGRHGVTVAGSGPAFWMAYVAEQRRNPTEKLFPQLRALVGGGAAKPPTINDEVRDVLGVVLATGYGSSECPGLAHSGVSDSDEVRRSDGYALDDVEIRIVDADGDPVAAGGEGEITVRGPMLFKGYLDPADNEGAFDGDGWFRTGDVGRLDTRGLLTVTGRLKDVIIRKGETISAKEIEDVLYLHGAIADVAAIPLPDVERGELCCAVIVLAGGAEPPTVAELAAHASAHGLAPQKAPERIEIVPVLPRNTTGKVLKNELIARYR